MWLPRFFFLFFLATSGDGLDGPFSHELTHWGIHFPWDASVSVWSFFPPPFCAEGLTEGSGTRRFFSRPVSFSPVCFVFTFGGTLCLRFRIGSPSVNSLVIVLLGLDLFFPLPSTQCISQPISHPPFREPFFPLFRAPGNMSYPCFFAGPPKRHDSLLTRV